MTIIAYRNGVMAADSSAWIGRSVHRWSRKLLRSEDGCLFGVTGQCAEGQAYLSWIAGFQQGREPMPSVIDGDTSFDVLRVQPDGKIAVLTQFGWEAFAAPYYVIGAAQAVAWGALFAGADAETAVRAAIEHSDAASGDVVAIRF